MYINEKENIDVFICIYENIHYLIRFTLFKIMEFMSSYYEIFSIFPLKVEIHFFLQCVIIFIRDISNVIMVYKTCTLNKIEVEERYIKMF